MTIRTLVRYVGPAWLTGDQWSDSRSGRDAMGRRERSADGDRADETPDTPWCSDYEEIE